MKIWQRTARSAAALLALCALNTAAMANDFTGNVRIVHINDVHAHIIETKEQIGYPKIAHFIAEERAAHENIIVLDAGDVIAGNPYASVDKGASFAPILNTLGLDVMTAGNAEFVFGSEHLARFRDNLDYPMLVGNMVYKDTEKPFADGHLILDLPNGLRAGIVGVTTPASANMGSNDLKYTDGVEATQRFVDEVRAAGADFVIGLLHVGEIDPTLNTPMIAERVKGLDVIIDGHSHTKHPNGLVHNDILIAQAGQFGENVGIVDLKFEKGEIVGVEASLVERAAFTDAPEKAETKAAQDAFLARADAFFDEVVGETTVQLEGRRDIVRTQETNLANLFTDAIRETAGTDLAFLPAGYIGGLIEPGPVNRRAIHTIARIEVDLVKVEMNGAQVVKYANSAAGTYPDPSGAFLHISGGSYRVDASAPKEDRVHSVTVAGQPIVDDKIYSVAVIASALERPGAKDAKQIGRVGTTAEILDAHVVANSPLSPKVEGRLAGAPRP